MSAARPCLHQPCASAVPQVVPGTRVGAGGPAGFPTLKTLALDSDVRMAGVEVFGQPSKKESLILLVKVRVQAGNSSCEHDSLQRQAVYC